MTTKWFFLATLGTCLNGAGLAFFGDAIIHRELEPGAFNAWFWDGIFATILINAGICCIAEAVKWSPRR